MSDAYGLVLACDLTPDGLGLGPNTILRLERGVAHHRETSEPLLVAASWSPRHPNQPNLMGHMMNEWFFANGCSSVVTLLAKVFNTRGELLATNELSISKLTIISDELHLQRTKILVERMQRKGMLQSMVVVYKSTDKSAMTAKGAKLEPLKRFFIRRAPFWLQDVVIFVMHKTPVRHFNASY